MHNKVNETRTGENGVQVAGRRLQDIIAFKDSVTTKGRTP